MAGAGSTSSSLTSTSHTLTLVPAMAPTSASASATSPQAGDLPAELALLGLMEIPNRFQFLRPEPSTPAVSLQVAKATLDAFAGQVSDEQQRRLREANKKRKRELDRADVLKIRKLHLDGFETGQVWQQAKRIISSALLESEALLQELEENGEVQAVRDGAGDVEARTLEFGKDGFEIDSEDEERSGDSASDSENDESGEDEDMSGASVEDSDAEASDEDGASGSEVELDGAGDFEKDEDEEGDEEDEENGGDEDDLNKPSSFFVEDPNGLNDGFFSIDDFNKQTQWFEDQDARADPNTDMASEDEELDWHADPMAAPRSKPKTKASSSSKKGWREKEEEVASDIAEDDDDDDEHGPTFGDMDLDAPEGASDEELDGNLERGGFEDGLDLTANDVFYKDFFAPPPRKSKRSDKDRGGHRGQLTQPKEYDVEAAMASVKRDLFEDLSEGSGSEDEDGLSEVDAGDPKARRSTHERRQGKILNEIRKLEAAMVKPKEWTLSGEAAAPERPLNSLLEEDLEFEHVGKPVPVITQEVSESIEDLIKRRIIAQEFDEVIRRLPGSEPPASTRRGLVELDDTKSKQGLAELYEEDYVKSANPDTYVSKSDEKMRKEEKEVEQMWKEISSKLDSLSSWHFKPKPAAPAISVVADVATVAMEDAQPTTSQGVSGGASMLAPQEVYKAGRDNVAKGEVLTARSGLPVARQEMSREEKLRRRRREKERIRKGGDGGASAANGTGAGGKTTLGKKAQEQKDTLSDLKKGGVMVINRRGDIMDVDGNKPKAARPVTSGSFKL